MKQRQQHVTKPIIHEKGPMYLSVVQRPPGAPPGGGMALNEAGGTPPGWYGAAYATVGSGCCTTSPWTTGSLFKPVARRSCGNHRVDLPAID